MMSLRVKPSALKDIIDEVDEDGSGYLEFEEFCVLSARFLVDPEDEESMKKELREAFRIYDKAGNGYIPISALKAGFIFMHTHTYIFGPKGKSLSNFSMTLSPALTNATICHEYS